MLFARALLLLRGHMFDNRWQRQSCFSKLQQAAALTSTPGLRHGSLLTPSELHGWQRQDVGAVHVFRSRR